MEIKNISNHDNELLKTFTQSNILLEYVGII
jgi:hypothetical protein